MGRITIIGLGLIGGSIGLRLKAQIGDQLDVVGYDEVKRSLEEASKAGAIDSKAKNLIDAVDGSEMVIISTPLLAMPEIMKSINPILKPGCVVTDTGSTKAQVMAWASNYLPQNINFVGGHPMAGKETSGIKHAEADLFEGATYCICPSPTASQRAIKMVEGLAEDLGAVTYFPDPSEHDSMVASISHLPIIVSSALMSLASSSQSWAEIMRLASSGFVGATRLASTDPSMSAGICTTNKEAISHWIDRLIEELQDYKTLLQSDGEKIREVFVHVKDVRENWILGKEDITQKSNQQIPNIGQRMTDMFIGEALSKRGQDFIDLYESKLKASKEDSDEKSK